MATNNGINSLYNTTVVNPKSQKLYAKHQKDFSPVIPICSEQLSTLPAHFHHKLAHGRTISTVTKRCRIVHINGPMQCLHVLPHKPMNSQCRNHSLPLPVSFGLHHARGITLLNNCRRYHNISLYFNWICLFHCLTSS